MAHSAEEPRQGFARWPTIAGLGFGAALVAVYALGVSTTPQVAQVLVAAGFVYAGSAALGRRSAAWPLFAVTFALIGVGFVAHGFDAAWAMALLVAVLALLGLARGRAAARDGLPLQLAAMAVIVVLAVVVALLPSPWGAVVAGAGLLAHAAWDVRHLRTRRVVAPTMAEFCCALDTVLGVGAVAVALVP